MFLNLLPMLHAAIRELQSFSLTTTRIQATFKD